MALLGMYVTAMICHPFGKMFITGSAKGAVKVCIDVRVKIMLTGWQVWDSESCTVVEEFYEHTSEVTAFAQRSTRLFSSSCDKSIKV